jgi:sortase A
MKVKVRLNRKRRGSVRLWDFCRYLLLVVGCAALSYTGCFYIDQYWHQYRMSQAFDRARVSTRPKEIPSSRPTFPARLLIDRLHLKTMIEEGVGESTLDHAAGHIPSTALPGQPGNVGVAAHRDTLFRSLRGIKKHDHIVISTLSQDYEYEVTGTSIVNPHNVSVLAPTQGQNTLTLVTCYPFYYVGSAPDRFIVRARQVSVIAANPPANAEVVSQPVVTEPANTAQVISRSRASHSDVGYPDTMRQDSRDRNVTNGNSRLQKLRFELYKSHSRELAPGISMGLTGTNVEARRANGWMWVMPDRRTIWLRDQSAHEPVVFYRDGRRRELVITNVAPNSVSGYLIVSESQQ